MPDLTPSLSSRAHPISPVSSPEVLKANPSPPSTVYNPNTPNSPPLMSVGTPSHASNLATSQTSTGYVPSSGDSVPSPPSSTQLSRQTALTSNESFSTLANGVDPNATSMNGQDNVKNGLKPMMQGSYSDSIGLGIANASEGGKGHQFARTDHDRQGPNDGMSNLDGGPVSNRDATDAAMNNSVHGDPSIDALQRDIGSAFHLCKTSPVISGPDPSLDLISLYNLAPIGKSVMRADPVTGEKINRLRKSYEGKLKVLGLSGRNKAVKHEGPSGGLRELTMWPEEEWRNQQVHGKEIKVADIDSSLYKLQMRAMKMEPGPLPNNERWEDLLGHEKPSKHQPVEVNKNITTPSNIPRPGQANGVAPVAVEPERVRSTRGKKRNYDDNSFVGYGEGYADDDDEGAFYSNAEEGRGKKKKRKKDHLSRVTTPILDRANSVNVGMYGIGAR